MTRWVQVKHDELLEYVAMVEYLRKDHTQLQEQIKDAKELASIIEATYKERLDKLTDYILDIHPANYKYERGLMDAYNIVAGLCSRVGVGNGSSETTGLDIGVGSMVIDGDGVADGLGAIPAYHRKGLSAGKSSPM